MRGNEFIDSNIWLYSFIEAAGGKHQIAARLIQVYNEPVPIISPLLPGIPIFLYAAFAPLFLLLEKRTASPYPKKGLEFACLIRLTKKLIFLQPFTKYE